MSILFREALSVQKIPSRRIILSRNLLDIYDSHTTVEVFFNNKWVIFDPTFNVSFSKDGKLLSSFDIQESLFNGTINQVHPVFYGKVRYPARLDTYQISWVPLFNNVFVVEEPHKNILLRLPPLRYFYGASFHYVRYPGTSDYFLRIFNKINFIYIVIFPIFIFAISIVILVYFYRSCKHMQLIKN